MKSLKKLLIILLMVVFIIPTCAFAEEKQYNTLNLDEALKAEEIEHDFSDYKENDDQITIYMFRGQGCGYCKKFLTFMNSIVDEYGKYFKVETYEVWNDSKNAELMQDIASFMGKDASGVPFIIIGDKSFNGYSESYDEDIKAQIKKLYNTKKKDRYDVMEEYKKSVSNEVKDYDSIFVGIITFSIIFSVICAVVVYIIDRNKINLLQERVEKLEKGKK